MVSYILNDLLSIEIDDLNIPLLKGDKGDTGKGIENIQHTKGTNKAGEIDEYTIFYTDGTSTVFKVQNGKDGKDGDITENLVDLINAKADKTYVDEKITGALEESY